MQQHDTAGKAEEMLVQKAKRHKKLRLRPNSMSSWDGQKGLSGWHLVHGPDQNQVTTGGIVEPCVKVGTASMTGG